MAKSSLRTILTLVLIVFLTVILAPWSYSQDLLVKEINLEDNSGLILQAQATQENESSEADQETSETKFEESPVRLDGETLFIIQRPIGEIPPEERAKDIMSKITKVAEDDSISTESLKITDLEGLLLIQSGDIMIAALGQEDGEADQKSLNELANSHLETIKTAIDKFRESRTKESLITGLFRAIIATLVAGLLLIFLNKILPALFKRIKNWEQQRLESLRIQGLEVIPRHQLAKLIEVTGKILRIALIFLLLYIYIPYVLSCFPWTKPAGNQILQNFWDAVNLIVRGFVGYLPNLFVIAIIGLIAFYSIKFARIFFNALRRGTIRIRGFYPEWATPTYNISVVLILGLAAVFIFPYLPASDSPGFQGISLFAGALFTLGSTAIIGNVISGIVLIYTRAFQVGDVIEVSGIVGRVADKTMLSTRLLTRDNEIITIPNASLFVSNITNFTAVIRDNKTPLILKTKITLGYDIPWRKVHQVLIDAALSSPGILPDPEPFVLQTSLDDFYVSYTLKAFTKEPDKMGRIYSLLHQNIQDKCNEADIEILSPHYAAVRDGHQITIPADYLPDDYQAPGFRLESLVNPFKSKSNDPNQ